MNFTYKVKMNNANKIIKDHRIRQKWESDKIFKRHCR